MFGRPDSNPYTMMPDFDTLLIAFSVITFGCESKIQLFPLQDHYVGAFSALLSSTSRRLFCLMFNISAFVNVFLSGVLVGVANRKSDGQEGHEVLHEARPEARQHAGRLQT